MTYALNDTSQLWYAFNDTTVVPVTEHIVRSSQAYVLFYRYRLLVLFSSGSLVGADGNSSLTMCV